jgi:Arc/MetJ-type ribon-helix-helix transcriptional regulator
MTIQLKPEQEHRIAEALRSGAYSSSDDVIDRALEVLHEQDEWLMANREANDAKIRAGIEALRQHPTRLQYFGMPAQMPSSPQALRPVAIAVHSSGPRKIH